jgi:hypothetical protein
VKRASAFPLADLSDLHVARHNIDPKPFIWAASASELLAKVTRAKAALAATAGRLVVISAFFFS